MSHRQAEILAEIEGSSGGKDRVECRLRSSDKRSHGRELFCRQAEILAEIEVSSGGKDRVECRLRSSDKRSHGRELFCLVR